MHKIRLINYIIKNLSFIESKIAFYLDLTSIFHTYLAKKLDDYIISYFKFIKKSSRICHSINSNLIEIISKSKYEFNLKFCLMDDDNIRNILTNDLISIKNPDNLLSNASLFSNENNNSNNIGNTNQYNVPIMNTPKTYYESNCRSHNQSQNNNIDINSPSPISIAKSHQNLNKTPKKVIEDYCKSKFYKSISLKTDVKPDENIMKLNNYDNNTNYYAESATDQDQEKKLITEDGNKNNLFFVDVDSYLLFQSTFFEIEFKSLLNSNLILFEHNSDEYIGEFIFNRSKKKDTKKILDKSKRNTLNYNIKDYLNLKITTWKYLLIKSVGIKQKCKRKKFI